MASETIVAVFTDLHQAEAAISDLVEAGVPASSIKHYARDEGQGEVASSGLAGQNRHHSGFWGWLTGQESSQDQPDAYDRSIDSGRTVVTVVSDAGLADEIHDMLERHNPVDIDDNDRTQKDARGFAPASTAGYVATGGFHEAKTAGTFIPENTGAGSYPVAETAPLYGDEGSTYAASGTRETSVADSGRVQPGLEEERIRPTGLTGDAEQVIPLSEETLQVGKREIDRGTTRIRRYTVERPVEEQIRLRDETVSVFRRPVEGSTAAGSDAFRDREIVVSESAEEAVVGKSTRVVEEVVVQKGVNERTETVRDTLRHDEVEIEGPAGREVMADRNRKI